MLTPVTPEWLDRSGLFANCEPQAAARIKQILVAYRIPIEHLRYLRGITTEPPTQWRDTGTVWRRSIPWSFMGPGHDEGIGLTDNSIIYVRGADLSPALVLHELGHHRLWVQFAGAREATQGDKDRLVRIRKRRIGPLLKLSEGELAALGLTKLSLANVFELGADAYLAAMHAAPEQVQRLSQALFGVDLTREQLIDYLDERLLKDDAAAAAVMADTLEAAAGVRRGSALTP